MRHLELTQLAKARRWPELEQQWLAAIDDTEGDVELEDFLPAIELTVSAGQAGLAETMAWAWLTEVKDRWPVPEALELARELLLRLQSGDQLRDEVLTLYRKAHPEEPALDLWIELSGLTSGKSVRRALRFLDVGLQLKIGAWLLHRSDEEAAELKSVDLAADSFTLRTAKRTRTLTVEELIESYEPADPDDYRVLRQLRPERIVELIASDPERLLIGIARAHRGQIDRDELKLLLAPKYMPLAEWNTWWNRARNAIKRSRHLRVEGRSPMMIVYEPGGLSLEDETWAAFEKADSPRSWLEVVEGYLREARRRKLAHDVKFLERVQSALVDRVRRYSKHEPEVAFATALVIERLAGEGLPMHPEAHGMAVEMVASSTAPASLVAALPDAALWSLALQVVRQALPDHWPDVFAGLMFVAPGAQLDDLAGAVEAAGRGDLIPPVVEAGLTQPADHVDVLLWIWRGPTVETPLNLPPRTELLTRILALVGPTRERAGAGGRGDVTAMRAKVRAALSARGYAALREMLSGIDEAMAVAFRRQIERAEGLGPVVQDEMMECVREHFPALYAHARAELWEEEGVLYVTSKGLYAREAERDELVNVKMRENARAIGAAAEHGDLSENSEYKFALEERDLLRARLAQINMELSMARVLEPADLPDDHVSIGHRVHLARDGGDELAITILGPWESDVARHIYSYQTPLARRVLGRQVGESVELSLDGREASYRIIRFEPAV